MWVARKGESHVARGETFHYGKKERNIPANVVSMSFMGFDSQWGFPWFVNTETSALHERGNSPRKEIPLSQIFILFFFPCIVKSRRIAVKRKENSEEEKEKSEQKRFLCCLLAASSRISARRKVNLLRWQSIWWLKWFTGVEKIKSFATARK